MSKYRTFEKKLPLNLSISITIFLPNCDISSNQGNNHDCSVRGVSSLQLFVIFT